MKYFKDNEGAVYAYETDGSQDELISNQMVQMVDAEIDRHLNPAKYYSDEEKYTRYIQGLKPLTRRQFMLTLDVSLCSH